MKELILLLVLGCTMNVKAQDLNGTKQRIINAVEEQAKKFKIIQDLDKMTNLKLGTSELKIRPNKFEFKATKNNKKFNITTNGKDSIRADFTLSF